MAGTHENPAVDILSPDRERDADHSDVFEKDRTLKPTVVERTFSDSGYRRRAGGIVCRLAPSGEIEILQVSSSKHKKSWVLPGGGVDPGEEWEDAAIREVKEEAGFLCEIEEFIGASINDKKKSISRYYKMKVKEELTESEDRKKQWFPVKDAIANLSKRKPSDARLLESWAST